MDYYDHCCERKLLSSHSTFGLPPVKSDSSLVDDNTGVERITKAFSPPENRLAPLLGKKLFMHYESGTARDKHIEQVLKKLKGEVVEFFSRDVDYVITNRISSRLASPTIDESPVTSSKQSTSLHNQLSSTSQTPNNLKVPVLIGSKPVNSPVTRGRAMLLAARKIATEDSNSTSSGITASSILNQAQTSNDVSVAPIQSQSSSMSCVLGSSQKLNSNNDLIYKARQLGIKILSIDTVTKWIKNLPSDVQSYIQSIQRTDHDDHLDKLTNDPERDRIHEVRHLVTPCIKVIDTKNHYRPIYLDKTDYLPDLWNLTNRYKSKSKSLLEVGVHDTPSSPIPITTTNTTVIITTTTTATITTTVTTANGPCSGSVPGASVGFTLQNPSHCIPGTGTQSVLTRRDSRNKRKHRLQKHNTATPLQRTASLVAKGTESNPKASSTTAAVNDEPSGYCECCSTNFKSLFEHLHCTDHQQFANNSENYRLLDDVLNKLPTFKEFLTKTASTTSQLPSYLNPIAISPCASQHEKDYLLNNSKCETLEKENIPPIQTKINGNIQPISVSQKAQSTLNDYENISKEINVPPTLNFSEPLGPNQFTDGNSDIFNNTDLDVCEISNTAVVVDNNNLEQISKLDQEEAAFLFLL
ncbi:unnamed protein product [Schistosoma margrebowiei]|uniref:DBF4-type domain-containing protein n=1 Tax=Schistosoma margrebowiei TaxID=48269 RepID=A0AA84ZSS0_9TREM|nr:unnamed protein product [Schistosoma margrebowiei]